MVGACESPYLCVRVKNGGLELGCPGKGVGRSWAMAGSRVLALVESLWSSASERYLHGGSLVAGSGMLECRVRVKN
jgi:hypothetical protein